MNSELAAATLSIALAAFAPADAEVNFSGTWSPDLNSHQRVREPKNPDPNAPRLPQPAGGLLYLPKLQIIDNGKSVDLYYVDDQGAGLSTQHLPTDGAEIKDAGVDAETPRLSRTSRSKNEIRTEWRFVRKGLDVVTGVNVWTLSADGATLTQTSTTEDDTTRTRTNTVYARLGQAAGAAASAALEAFDLRGLWSNDGFDRKKAAAIGLNSDDWTSPKKVKHVNPLYPREGKDRRVQGLVLLNCRLGTDGLVSGCAATRTPAPFLTDAAIAAVTQWQYTPFMINGAPRSALIELPVTFRLN